MGQLVKFYIFIKHDFNERMNFRCFMKRFYRIRAYNYQFCNSILRRVCHTSASTDRLPRGYRQQHPASATRAMSIPSSRLPKYVSATTVSRRRNPPSLWGGVGGGGGPLHIRRRGKCKRAGEERGLIHRRRPAVVALAIT